MKPTRTPYIQKYWKRFEEIDFYQGKVGCIPSKWAERNGWNRIRNYKKLPKLKCSRMDVRRICRDPACHVLFGYVCVMAWGQQHWHVPGYEAHRKIVRRLRRLRKERLSHYQVYNLFTGKRRIPGLGPSFFTKLIYFFSSRQPIESARFYIMDQWTAKSINLLTGRRVVLLAPSPTTKNTYENYEAYCQEVDCMAKLLGIPGDKVEERLMSKGGRDKAAGEWRKHVRQHWRPF